MLVSGGRCPNFIYIVYLQEVSLRLLNMEVSGIKFGQFNVFMGVNPPLTPLSFQQYLQRFILPPIVRLKQIQPKLMFIIQLFFSRLRPTRFKFQFSAPKKS